MRFLIILASCAVLLVQTGCKASQQPASDFDPLDWSDKNCLVIVLDALTVNHLALWGYDRETTPNLDRLAARGVVFKFARSQASSTPPSVYSYFTGQYPPLLLLDDTMRMVQLPEAATTFAEAFRDAGYDTAAFSENMYVSPKAGFDQGFETFELILRHLPSGSAASLDEHSTEKLVESARTWIQSRDEKPWLCYMHLLRPHNPYRAPDPEGRAFAEGYDGPVDGSDAYWKSVNWKPGPADILHLKDFYDGNLLYVDMLVGKLLDSLTESGDLADTAIIVTSDHGEAFLEHGYTLHNWSVHEELIRVPMIVVPPIDTPVRPLTIKQPVQLVDLFPTMNALFGLKAANGVDGVSLTTALGGASLDARSMFAQDGDGDIMCVIDGGRKLLIAFDRNDSSFKPIELYHLTRDPRETRNLLQGLPSQEVEALFDRAQTYIEAHIRNQSSLGEDLVETEKEILETLGYL